MQNCSQLGECVQRFVLCYSCRMCLCLDTRPNQSDEVQPAKYFIVCMKYWLSICSELQIFSGQLFAIVHRKFIISDLSIRMLEQPHPHILCTSNEHFFTDEESRLLSATIVPHGDSAIFLLNICAVLLQSITQLPNSALSALQPLGAGKWQVIHSGPWIFSRDVLRSSGEECSTFG